MAKIPGTNVASPIAPFTTDDQFPTHDAIYGKGGQREVATIAERDAIPTARLTEGCTCYVAATEKTYRWKSNAWVDDTPQDGSDGAPGADGKDGKDGTDGAPGAPGADGNDGASAYEVYVANLQPGETQLTEKQWLESLKGPKGDQGAKGDTVVLGDGQAYTLYNMPGGNTDGAMTQAAVTDALDEYKTQIDATQGLTPDKLVISSGKWYSASSARKIAIPVTAGEVFKIVGNDTRAGHYAFLTAIGEAGSTPSYASGSLETIAVSTSYRLVVPSGTVYLYIETMLSNNDTAPSSVTKIVDATLLKDSDVVDNVYSNATDKPLSAAQGKYLNGKICELSDTIEDGLFAWLDATEGLTPDTLGIFNGKWYSSNNLGKIAIPVNAGDTFKIVGNDTRVGHYAFLTALGTSGNAPDYADGGGLEEIAVSASLRVIAPEHALYLYIETKMSGNNTAPSSVTKKVEAALLKDSDVIDNVTSDEITKPLSAAQGKYVNEKNNLTDYQIGKLLSSYVEHAGVALVADSVDTGKVPKYDGTAGTNSATIYTYDISLHRGLLCTGDNGINYGNLRFIELIRADGVVENFYTEQDAGRYFRSFFVHANNATVLKIYVASANSSVVPTVKYVDVDIVEEILKRNLRFNSDIKFACLGDSITSNQIDYSIGNAVNKVLGTTFLQQDTADATNRGNVTTEFGNLAIGSAKYRWEEDIQPTFARLTSTSKNNVISNQVLRLLQHTTAEGAQIQWTHPITGTVHSIDTSVGVGKGYVNDLPDIILIAASTNDSTPTDDYASVIAQTYDGLDQTSFCAAIRWCVETLQINYPKARIFLETPLRAKGKSGLATKTELIKKMAEWLGVCVVDSYNNTISELMFDTYYLSEDSGRMKVHPNEVGANFVAQYVAGQIKAGYGGLD